MISLKIIPILIVYSCLSRSAVAQDPDFSMTVLPITELKVNVKVKLKLSGPAVDPGVEVDFGTGFCLDPECRLIGTNYHVAVRARPRKIKGVEVIRRYLATGPDDEGATFNHGPSIGPYTLSRDLAIFELRHSLPHHHGVPFSLDDPEVGQEIDIYAYPKKAISPIRSLQQFHGTFKGKTTTGLLAFDYGFSDGEAIRSGASGGIVVDRKTQKIVGILNGMARNGEAIALAVPVQSLADFVSKVQPFLAQTIFPTTKDVSPVSADLYPKFVPPPDLYPKFVPRRADGLQHRPEEPSEVGVLRQKAQLLADSIRNFIAVESFAWGSGDRDPDVEAAYEVRIVDGEQRFRSYPEGKKELDQVPSPRMPRSGGSVTSVDEWSQLPKMVGTEFRLKVHQAPDFVVNERRMKVFQYYASVEDKLCPLQPFDDFGFFIVRHKTVAVACYGEVWTDEDTNIMRMSEHLELSDKLKAYQGWKDYQVVLTYGWLKRADEPSRLVPLTIYTQAENNKKIYWCRGAFMNYQVFSSSVKILLDSAQFDPPN